MSCQQHNHKQRATHAHTHTLTPATDLVTVQHAAPTRNTPAQRPCQAPPKTAAACRSVQQEQSLFPGNPPPVRAAGTVVIQQATRHQAGRCSAVSVVGRSLLSVLLGLHVQIGTEQTTFASLKSSVAKAGDAGHARRGRRRSDGLLLAAARLNAGSWA